MCNYADKKILKVFCFTSLSLQPTMLVELDLPNLLTSLMEFDLLNLLTSLMAGRPTRSGFSVFGAYRYDRGNNSTPDLEEMIGTPDNDLVLLESLAAIHRLWPAQELSSYGTYPRSIYPKMDRDENVSSI